ncbi:hypothetical protein MVEN_00441800 [Mycena venus]|uniref:DUF6534 domain-containing protein n=1 Tax=Mycena venus TaxID=2733690 RepID=A0A8H7DBK5_9AGAR|nr:hypothetical protein MVEN_00441800 [Mycena venus]
MASVVTFDANTTLGIFEIGVLVSYVLLGVTATQAYIYSSRFPDDSFRLKALVAFVCLCEVAHAICLGHTLYAMTISDYGHPERVLGAVPKSFPTAVILSGIIGASVQGFFSSRIYRLSEKLCIPILCWTMSFLRVVLAIVVTVPLLRETSVPKYEVQWRWALTAVWIVNTLNDLTIAVTLVIILIGRRKNVAHKRTTALVDKLILWTIETGMLTSVASMITLACFIAMKDNFAWVAFFSVSARFISNSLLANLNSRATLRAMDQVNMSLSFPTMGMPASNNVQMSKAGRDAGPEWARGPSESVAAVDGLELTLPNKSWSCEPSS